MGIYLNPGNNEYRDTVNSQVFVDHSLMIAYTNRIMKTNQKYICVSRPRRFGKSTDANMLTAYYSKGCDSSNLFDHLKIAEKEGYREHLNQHNVIHLNMQQFLSSCNNVEDLVKDVSSEIGMEIQDEIGIEWKENGNITRTLAKAQLKNEKGFIFVIDEWDCIFREYQKDTEAQKKYLDYLRNLLKDQPYVELAYMTGILPIRKYGTHSAINMFKEVSVLNPTPLETYTGFTEEEVENLCKKFDVSYTKMKEWYDGYNVGKGIYVYNPLSVVYSIADHKFENYWTQTETYEALKIYIDMNYDGLKDAIIRLLAGESVLINPERFQNDMTSFAGKDDVLTLMIHLGYLGYNREDSTCYIPNKEVRSSFVNAIDQKNMGTTAIALENSQNLLKATLNKDEEKVAEYIEEAHLETSHLTYNDENALAYTISLAYYTARDRYTVVREYPGGKGFADLVFIPKKDEPAMIVELKWDESAETALTQIKEKKYPKGLEKYRDNLLLVGISYDRKSRKHTCRIEKA